MMATPEFIRELRRHVGTAPLWLSGVTMIVVDAPTDHALFVRRADTGAWTPVTGIIDPGEEPAVAGIREVWEESGLRVRVEHLVKVGTVGPVTYPNGDVASYLDLTFCARHLSGEPYPADGENTEARWFPIDAPPPLNDRFQRDFAAAIADLNEGTTKTRFST